VFARLSPLLAIAAALCFAAPAAADQFNVTGTTDPVAGGGTCNGGPPAWTCTTLRAAVTAANANADEDEIFLQAAGAYRLTSAVPLTLLHDVTIAGQGPRVTQIDGEFESQVLIVNPGVTASLVNVAIQNGDAGGTGFGGNIQNLGNLTLIFSRVTGGHAARGGGIASRQGTTLGVFNSLVDHNNADLGGGIDIFGIGGVDPTPSELDVSNSTLAFNFSPNDGGALRVEGGVSAVIVSSTIARSTLGGGIAITDGAQSDVELFGSLLAGNLGGNCPGTAKPADEQYNLDDANTCLLGDPSSKFNTDPGLDEDLRDRGGPTDVLPFLNANSPAIDMVGLCLSSIDQRGYARITQFGQRCDAGAYEQSAQGTPQPTISSGPSATTTATSASFSFQTLDESDTFVCQLTGPGHAGGYQPCTSPATYSGLAPGDYIFSVAIADASGQQPSGTPTVRAFRVTSPAAQTPAPTPTPTATPSPTPTPEPQKAATGKPSGTVLIKLPGGKFAPLDPSKPIPDGAEIDVTKGRITLTAVLKKGGKPQTATFYDGIFKLKLGKTTTDLVLSQPLAPCKRGASAAAKKPKSRKLWGNGSGSFRTRGQYSAATVRGTEWLVQDSCAGTLTRVKKGSVKVRDNVKRKTIILRAGKKYLARPKR
jgi:hypothetical protein